MTEKELLLTLLENLQKMQGDVTILKDTQTLMQQDINLLKYNQISMRQDICLLQEGMQFLKLTVENEIKKNIQIIAEGHLDLMRNLREAQEPHSSVEILEIRVQTLENDVQQLKYKMA